MDSKQNNQKQQDIHTINIDWKINTEIHLNYKIH